MRKQTKRIGLSLASAALCLAALASPAAAAPALQVQVAQPASLKRGDSYFTYVVTVRNTGSSATTAPTNLSFGLPPGALFDGLTSGSGWACFSSAETCTYSGPAVADEADFPPLTVGVFLDPQVVASPVATTFTAFGGGAAHGGVAQHSFQLGSPIEFGLVDGTFLAGACKEAPAQLVTPDPACHSAGLGDPYAQAGGHPFAANTAFRLATFKTKPDLLNDFDMFENLRDAAVNLPPGFVANPTAVPGGCTIQDVQNADCAPRFAVGRAWATFDSPGFFGTVDQRSTVFKLVSEEGYPARFAFRPISLSPVTVVLRPKVRPGDFTVTAFAPLPPQSPALFEVKYFTFCSYGAEVVQGAGDSRSPGCKDPGDPTAFKTPFFTNPPRCNGERDVTSIDVASYQNRGRFDSDGFPDLSDPNWKTSETTSPELEDCNQLEFEPTFEGRPTTNVADQPTGLNFTLDIPQEGLLGKDENGNPDPNALATPHLKKTTVVLPEGLVVNPSSATGLAACSTEQMGLVTLNHPGPFPIQFNGKPVECPNGSKLGTVEVTSPLIDETLIGGFYLAEQDDPATTTPGAENPYDSTLAVYLAIRNDEIGVSAKLAGKVETDPVTGKITTTFDNNPQLPFDELRLRLPEGPRASLRTPMTCGPKQTSAEFTPWSFPDTGPPASPVDAYAISTPAPEAGVCPANASQIPSAPRFSAGTEQAKAGAYSPFTLRLSRPDGTRELTGLEATLPPGLTGRLAGVPYCPEADIQRAKSREAPRKGSQELGDPSCPKASELGTIKAAAGAGDLPYRTQGKAYLSGPYKSAPISLVAIVPAVAGPFDLGNVVVRTALHVDPVSAQVTAKSDPFPTIIDGIPLDVREIEVSIERDQFTLNPTNCSPLAFSGTAQLAGAEAALSERFQVGECAELAFKPTTSIQLFGGVTRAKYQGVRAIVRPRAGDANIAGTVVRFPSSAFVAQEHLQNICTRVQWAADNCPPNSVYGTAEALSPLLDQPLKGKVHLRSSNNLLPDLVADLRGPEHQPIRVEVAVKNDSVKGALRNTVQTAPDAPVTFFRLQVFGGKKGLIVNSRNICKDKNSAQVSMRAHNGRRSVSSVPVRNAKCAKFRKAQKRKAAKRKRMAAAKRSAASRAG